MHGPEEHDGEERGALSRRPERRHYACVAAAVFLVFLGVSLRRLIDGDEGFYLVAARLIREGKRPYGDFFYLQMPVFPYVVAGWMSVVGAGWYSARILAAILAAGIGLLVFHHAARRTQSLLLAALAVLLFAASGLSLGWFSAVKTYGLSEVLLLVCFLCAGSRRRGALVVSGICLGLATSVRLYVIVAGPCVALYLARSLGPTRALVRSLGTFAAGTAVGLSSCVPFLLRDREAFVFDTITFHSLRYPEGGESLIGDFGQKWETVLSLLGLRASEGTGGIQFLLLLGAGLYGCWPGRGTKNSLSRYFWVALGITSLLPNPTFNQYFCLLVPFLAVDVVEQLHAAWPLSGKGPALLGLGCIAYVALGGWDARRFVATGVRVPGIEEPSNAVNWSIPTVEAIGRGVDRVGADSGTSFWPGYFAFTRTKIPIEMANDFSIRAAPKLSLAELERYHIPSYEDIARMIQMGSPRVFVEGNWSPPKLGRLLREHGYQMNQEVGRARIWVHPPSSP
jgi:hypothetical protein